LWLEARLSKADILSRYLSSVYFGDNVFGLAAAANHYFSKTPDRLTTAEAAMLAGLVKAPSRLAPTRNLKAARERARTVVRAMVAAGMLTEAESRRLKPARLRPGAVKDVPSGTYFADWVFPQAEALIEDRVAEHSVVTTLEDRLQRAAAAAVRGAGLGSAQVALVAMRTDGRVVAMIGGRNYRRSPFNRATQARRQPGSTFKLFVYLAALRAGMSPGSLVQDTPLRLGAWSPGNYEDEYRGTLTLRQAFALSSNVAAVRLSEQVGRDQVRRAARDLGVTAELEGGPTVALGTSAIPLIEMVSAYTAVAAGAAPVRPRGLPVGTPPGRPLDSRVRAGLVELLRAAISEGTGRAALLPVPTFGKTGTSQGSRDAYFIGFAADLVAGVWIGRDDNRPMGDLAGGGLPAQIWRRFMVQAVTAGSASVPASEPIPEDAPLAPEEPEAMPFYVREYDVEEAGAEALLPETEEPAAVLPPEIGEPDAEPQAEVAPPDLESEPAPPQDEVDRDDGYLP
jgi:penicillin-binding protein 1A